MSERFFDAGLEDEAPSHRRRPDGQRLVDGPGRGGLALEADAAGEVACGSMSTSRTRCSASASAAARLMAVVVLPTPPF